MNLRKGQESLHRLIDYDLCRVVVPLSLSGTFLGVILNRHLPGWLTLSVLTGVLVFLTVSMVCETRHQYVNECKTLDMLAEDSSEGSSNAVSGGSGGPSRQSSGGSSAMLHGLQRQVSDPASHEFTWCDFCILVGMLALVIVAGVLRFHASRCARSPEDLRNEYCNHRALFWLPFGTMEQMVHTQSFATEISVMAMVVPLVVCSSVGLAYATLLVKQNTWKLSGVATYSSMALGTGILSGLLGIGGGLIFSPFFLLMGQRPSVAVATSSTCACQLFLGSHAISFHRPSCDVAGLPLWSCQPCILVSWDMSGALAAGQHGHQQIVNLRHCGPWSPAEHSADDAKALVHFGNSLWPITWRTILACDERAG